MTALAPQALECSTSAAGAMRGSPARETLVLGIVMIGLGTSPSTSASSGLPVELASRAARSALQTNAGATLAPVDRAGAAIGELRRVSGLTWEQLARLFHLSRRSLHFWASGKAMSPSNEEHLQRLLAVVRRIDRGSARANRAALLAVGEAGVMPFDLLANDEYERVVALIGGGTAPRATSRRPSSAARAARAPRPPEELVGALHDRVHREPAGARAAKSVRVRSGG